MPTIFKSTGEQLISIPNIGEDREPAERRLANKLLDLISQIDPKCQHQTINTNTADTGFPTLVFLSPDSDTDNVLTETIALFVLSQL